MMIRPIHLSFLVLKLTMYFLFTLLSVSCASISDESTHQLIQKESAVTRILLVNTNNSIERYRIAQTAFIETLKGSSVNTIDLGEDNQPVDTLQDLLNEQDYDAIYCIGAKALGTIDYIDPEAPVIFSSVLNWRRFSTQPNYYGVASEVAPEAQLAWFKYFFPEIKKIGVLYSDDNQKLIEDARSSAEKLYIQIVTEKVYSQDKLTTHANKLLSEVDALWLISDPSVLASSNNARLLFHNADKKQVPIFAYNSFFVDMGAMLSISADLSTTGRQAAIIVRNVLQEDMKGKSVQFPAGSCITLNLDKVRFYNIELNDSALDSVNEIVEE